MTPSLPSAFVDHLWQSTLFIGVVWVATLTLRRNSARVRYWLWVAASVKFLVPLSWLVSVGERLDWRSAPVAAQPAASFVVEQIFAAPIFDRAAPVAASPVESILPWLLLVIWSTGVAALLIAWWREWLPVRAALRGASALTLPPASDAGDLKVMCSPSIFEPGLVGVFRPVLLLPDDLVARLTPAQMKALIAHERCHAQHRDNLFAAIQMLVEALFWFHPLVWWIEERMVHERERACDEAVLQSGAARHDYAEGILEVCRRSVASPLPCIAGVAGANLRRRIESIMLGTPGRPLTVAHCVALTIAAAAVLTAPVIAGAMNAAWRAEGGAAQATPGRIQQPDGDRAANDARPQFDVASVKRVTLRPGETTQAFPGGIQQGGRWFASYAPLVQILRSAYPEYVLPGQIIGGPEWVNVERFEVDARTGANVPRDQIRLMLQRLLAERFKLSLRTESRPFDVYALVMARGDGRLGPRLRPQAVDCAAARAAGRSGGGVEARPTPEEARCFQRSENGPNGTIRFRAPAFTIDGGLTTLIRGSVDRPIVDRTGLTGLFDIDLEFMPSSARERGNVDLDAAPSLFTALQEQLGLKLEPRRESLNVLVIEHVEMPTPN